MQQNTKPTNRVNQIEETQSKQHQTNQQTNKKLSRKLKLLIITSAFGVSLWAFNKYLETEVDLAVSLSVFFLFFFVLNCKNYETRYLNDIFTNAYYNSLN